MNAPQVAPLEDAAASPACSGPPRPAFHIVEPDPTIGAALRETAAGHGHHVHVYASVWEMRHGGPMDGVLLIREAGEWEGGEGTLRDIRAMAERLPIVMTSTEVRADKVVAAMKAGALDYLDLRLPPAAWREVIARIVGEAKAHAEAWERLSIAQRRLSALTRREKEVFEQLAQGSVNKEVAQALGISPRTVEIHRANLLAKLRVKNMVEAMHLRYASGRG